MPLNDTDDLIRQTLAMRLSEKNSLEWLKAHGHEISRSTYWRRAGRIKASSGKRKFQIMQEGLLAQHIERIDQLETILKISWENFHRAQVKNPIGAQRILDSITNIQPMLSQYYEETQYVVENEKADIPAQPPEALTSKPESTR